MRDQRFVAQHRGGPLSKTEHQLMARWAAECVEHLLASLWQNAADRRPFVAIQQAKAWANGEISVGKAREHAVAAHAAAREATNPIETAMARAAGHAVATAHMADHCLGGAGYTLTAAKLAGLNVEMEKAWQNAQLPASIRELILEARAVRGADPK